MGSSKRQDLGPQLKKIARLFRRSRATKEERAKISVLSYPVERRLPVAGVILVLKAGFAVCFWSQVNKHSEFIHFTKTAVRWMRSSRVHCTLQGPHTTVSNLPTGQDTIPSTLKTHGGITSSLPLSFPTSFPQCGCGFCSPHSGDTSPALK